MKSKTCDLNVYNQVLLYLYVQIISTLALVFKVFSRKLPKGEIKSVLVDFN